MSKLLGANWQTSLLGWITILAVAIAAKPELISFLPDSWEPVVAGICGLIAVVSGGAFAYKAKDKNVTGGTTQQTADGQVASAGAQFNSEAVKTTKVALPQQ